AGRVPQAAPWAEEAQTSSGEWGRGQASRHRPTAPETQSEMTYTGLGYRHRPGWAGTRLHTSRRGADATARWDVTMIGPDDISLGFRALLDRAGWHPGRRVGMDEWVSRLRAEGFTVNASA